MQGCHPRLGPGLTLSMPNRTGPGFPEPPSYEALVEAERSHGDGFWLVSLPRIRTNLAGFRKAFADAGLEAIELCWSVKTQWLPAVLKAVLRESVTPEVVSGHELDLVLALGADPTSVIYNGVGKSPADVARALRMGIRVHLDSEAEVEYALRFATDNPATRCRIGLRANIDLGLPSRGRFGLDAESGGLQSAWRRLGRAANVALEGLHVHASGARGAEQFALRMQRMIALSDELFGQDAHPRYIDLGGGFYGSIPPELAAQMSQPIPTFAEYAQAIARPFRDRWPRGGPSVAFEPGAAVAADTAWFAAKVLAVKDLGGERHVITAASVETVKPMRHPMDMPFFHVPAPGDVEEAPRTCIVSGYTCMESDILHRNARASFKPGDWLLFLNCGAYTNVMTPRFIRGVPATIVEEDGDWRTAARVEDVDDWLRPSRDVR